MLTVFGIVVVLIGVIVASLDKEATSQRRGEEILPATPREVPLEQHSAIPAGLRRAQFALKRKEEFVNEQVKEMGFQRRELHLQQWSNDLFWREHFLVNTQQRVQLTAQELEITNLHRELDQKKVDIQQYVKEQGFALQKEELKNIGEKIRNERDALKNDQINLDLKKKEVELSGQEISQQITKQMFELEHKDIGLKKFEVELKGQELKQQVFEAAVQLQSQLLDFKEQKLTFREEMVGTLLGIRFEKDMLSIRHAKIDLLERSINEMYKVKSEWLKIEARQNQQDARDQQHQLRKLYDETMSKIRELRLTRWENNLHWDQKEVQRKQKIMQYIEEKWTQQYYSRGERITMFQPREAMKDLMNTGYLPESPLIAEVKRLKEQNQTLRYNLYEERNKDEKK